MPDPASLLPLLPMLSLSMVSESCSISRCVDANAGD